MIEDILNTLITRLNAKLAGEFDAFTFIYGPRKWANVKAETLPFPYVVYDTLQDSGTMELHTNERIEDVNRVEILFLSKTRFDDTPTVRKPVAFQMKQAAKHFIILARKSEFVHSPKDGISNIRYQRVQNFLDTNTDGYILTFDMVLSDIGFNYCLILNQS